MQHVLEAVGTAQIIQFRGPQLAAGFSTRDLIELACWRGEGRRLEVDDGAKCNAAGQFAIIYDGDEPWASWAISRDGGCVLLWDCVSLADIGRFASVAEALAALPGGQARAPDPLPRTCAEVVPLRQPRTLHG